MREKKYTHFTRSRQEKFFALLAEGSTISHAARAVGISRENAYVLRRTDSDFRAAWEEAYEQGIQTLEEEARRRAVDGVVESVPIYFQGQQVGEYRRVRYSDTLLIKLLEAKRPEVYRQRTDITVGAPQTDVDLSALSDDEIAVLSQIRARLDAAQHHVLDGE